MRRWVASTHPIMPTVLPKPHREEPRNASPRAPGPYADPPMPPYRVEADGFDGARAADIKAVCDSAGRELWRHFPGHTIEPFVVTRGHKGPIVLYERNARGEIVMRLDTGRTFWSQYAYQFAHEFCHILCGFDKDDPGNKWFEETLCETASLYALRAMARAWKTDPPYPHWRDYRDALRDYTDDILAKRHKVDEIHRNGLAAFYRAHRAELTRHSCNRDLNGAMAVVLLRLLEREPNRWEAVRWLNAGPAPAGRTFPEYLQAWHDAAPGRHKPFIRQVADLYGIPLRAERSAETTDSTSAASPRAHPSGADAAPASAGGRQTATYTNPVIAETLADPSVIFHEGVYYLYGTGQVSGGRGYRVYTSADLVHWRRGPVVFRQDEPNAWAPDVWRDPASGRFYLYYTVNRTVGVAEAAGPLGPFTIRRTLAEKAIDAHLFRDDDGRLYLYVVQVPGFRITVRPMAGPTEPAGRPKVILQPESDWETRNGRVTEGPWLIKHAGRYVLLYSGSGANTPDYAVGYATASSPLGPFTRAGHNPILHRSEGVYGPGHGCAVRDRAGQWWFVYHQKRTAKREWGRFVCLDRLRFDEEGRLFGKATRGTPQPAPVGSDRRH